MCVQTPEEEVPAVEAAAVLDVECVRCGTMLSGGSRISWQCGCSRLFQSSNGEVIVVHSHRIFCWCSRYRRSLYFCYFMRFHCSIHF